MKDVLNDEKLLGFKPTYKRPTKKFKKFCKYCDKLFRPSGRDCEVCNKCREKHMKNKGKNQLKSIKNT